MSRVRFVVRKKEKKSPLANILSLRFLVHGPDPDYPLLLCVLGLVIFGWVTVYSSSALFAESRYGNQFFFLKRQVIWSMIGFGGFLVASNIPISLWQRSSRLVYAATMTLLLLVLFIGPEVAGARRWIRLGFFNLQPSELAKIALVLLVADYLDRRQSRLRDFKRGLLPILTATGAMLLLIFMEPDLGTPMLMAAVALALLILGGARFGHLFLISLATLPIVVFSVLKVRYRLERIFAYLDPWSDPFGAGYQLVQSLLALGSGGIFGRGLGSSKIKIAHLPDAHTDFVFAVLGEELGLVGTLLVTALFLFVAIRGLGLARRTKNTFASLTAAGISLLVGLQALINMGVASGLFPTKGMPLPLLSFGGSSLVITLTSIGILTRISKIEGEKAPGDVR